MRYLASIAVLFALVAVSSAKDAEQEPTAKEIRALIDRLVSPNPAPITGDDDKDVEPDYKLPAGFNRKKQETARSARGKLMRIGPAAFPHLIERWSDKRFSLTLSSGISGYSFNASVGDVCREIIFNQLQPYGTWPRTDDDPRGKPPRPGYPSAFLRSSEAAAKWYQENKANSLYQMQLMAIDWVMQQESKRPGDFTTKETAELQEIHAQLVKIRMPIERGIILPTT